MQDKISTNLSLPLTFQEETAHLDASEEQTERIQANLSPCKPAQNISLPPSFSLSPSLSLPSLPLPSQAGNDEIVLWAEGGVKSEAVESIRRLRCFWPTALRDCELVAHEEQEGGGGRVVGDWVRCSRWEKKSLPAMTSWNPRGPPLSWDGTAQRSLRKQTVSAAAAASSWGYNDAATAWTCVNLSRAKLSEDELGWTGLVFCLPHWAAAPQMKCETWGSGQHQSIEYCYKMLRWDSISKNIFTEPSSSVTSHIFFYW